MKTIYVLLFFVGANPQPFKESFEKQNECIAASVKINNETTWLYQKKAFCVEITRVANEKRQTENPK